MFSLRWLRSPIATFFVMVLAWVVPTHVRADQAGPPTTVSAVRGKISEARLVEIDPSTKFILIAVSDLVDAATPPVVSPHQRLVPLRGSCAKVWAAITSTEPDIVGVVGRAVDGLTVVTADPPRANAGYCPLLSGHENLMREASALPARIDWAEHAKKQKDAILPALATMRDFFVSSRDQEMESPVENDVRAALSQLDSEASLEFALERRMYFFATHNHFKWRRTPSNFALVSRELVERPWAAVANGPAPGRVPSGSLTELFWMTSPSQAALSLRKLYDAEPEKVMTILRSSPPRDDVMDLLIELTARDRTRWLSSTLGSLGMKGHERTLPFMQKELGAAAGDELRLAKRIAAIEHRAKLGVTDGSSLARHLWAHRNDPYSQERPFRGMRVELVGHSDGCCSVVQDLGDGVKLDGKVDCDAESFVAMCKVPRGTVVTATGVVEGDYVGAREGHRYVRLDIESASVRVGGDLSPKATPDPSNGEPSSQEPSSARGCACATGGSRTERAVHGSTLVSMLVLVLLRRRSGARRSRR